MCHLSGQEAFFVGPLTRETYLLSGTLGRGRWAVSRKCIMIQKDNKQPSWLNKFIFSPKRELSLAGQTQEILSAQDRLIVPVQIAYQKAGFASSWLHWKNNKFKAVSNVTSKQPNFISNITLLINNDLHFWHFFFNLKKWPNFLSNITLLINTGLLINSIWFIL